MLSVLLCVFSIFLQSNDGIPNDHTTRFRAQISLQNKNADYLRAKRHLSSSSDMKADNEPMESAIMSKFVQYSKNKPEHHRIKNRIPIIELRRSITPDHNGASRNDIILRHFNVWMYGDKTRGIHKNASSTYINKHVARHRHRRSNKRRPRSNAGPSNRSTAFNFRDLKHKIIISLAHLDDNELKRSRRQSNRIKAVINEPDLGVPEPYVPPTTTPLPGCCTAGTLEPPGEPEYLNMTGDHMNIYPEAPEWGYPEIEEETMKPWWYYNQDDFMDFRPAVPNNINRT